MIISVTHIKTSVTQLRLENVYRQTDLPNVDTVIRTLLETGLLEIVLLETGLLEIRQLEIRLLENGLSIGKLHCT